MVEHPKRRFTIQPHKIRHGSTVVLDDSGAEWVLVRAPFVVRAVLAVGIGLALAALPLVALHFGVQAFARARGIALWLPLATLGVGLAGGGFATVGLWPATAFSLLTNTPETSMFIRERRSLMGATRKFAVMGPEGDLVAGVVVRSPMGLTKRASIEDRHGDPLGEITERRSRALQRVGAQTAVGWLEMAGRYGRSLGWLTRRMEPVHRMTSLDLDVTGPDGDFVGYISLALQPTDASVAEIGSLDPRVVLLAGAVLGPERI